ncbi:hypothetical protein O6P43_005042 [Quillaja saponaria]|uniref:Uncharacterized protein n=1 Tax=Quillaja saponaria TaxID=32244 RepID=A0AAD7Q543_QUISA|nr:hypothetical protein O6P43_005042 [Quillaja saponaria]
MHLWPSMKIRDSFSVNYLRKLEWNLHRMKIEKQTSRNQNLLDNEGGQVNGIAEEIPNSKINDGFGTFCWDMLTILSCCCCCFCCGVCVEEN